MSRSTDRYRPPYGRHLIEVPRESVFAGTVNHDTYLKDETGGRRFWPAKCGTIRIEELRRDRDQLWAEAVARFRAGETWWIDSPELSATAAEERQQRYDEDAWQPLIEDWVQGREHVTVERVLRDCIGKQPKDWTQGDKARIGRCLHALGWTRKRAPKDEEGHRRWSTFPVPACGACPRRPMTSGTPHLVEIRPAVPASHLSHAPAHMYKEHTLASQYVCVNVLGHTGTLGQIVPDQQVGQL